MFQENSSFRTFVSALKDKARLEVHLQPLSEKVCLLYPEGARIRFVCYRCGAGRRIPVDGVGRCVHIDEDVWVTRPDILLSRITALMGQASRIHARDTVLARIEKRIALLF